MAGNYSVRALRQERGQGSGSLGRGGTGRVATVGPGGADRLGAYVLLATSCDKTLATTVAFTSVRVVCQNTLAFAFDDMRQKGRRHMKISHSLRFDAGEVKEGRAETIPFARSHRNVGRIRPLLGAGRTTSRILRRLYAREPRFDSTGADPPQSVRSTFSTTWWRLVLARRGDERGGRGAMPGSPTDW